MPSPAHHKVRGQPSVDDHSRDGPLDDRSHQHGPHQDGPPLDRLYHDAPPVDNEPPLDGPGNDKPPRNDSAPLDRPQPLPGELRAEHPWGDHTRLAARVCGSESESGWDTVRRLEPSLQLTVGSDGWVDFNGRISTRATRVQRALDVVCGSILLVVGLPIMALVAAILGVAGGGPVLFRQRRVGWGGREFTMLKFRTMRADAEADGPRWAELDDARVTRLGRWLRLTHLDELPQLVHVVQGDMSLIGPRPERPEFVVDLVEQVPWYHLRHVVRPGVTGWAQVNQGYVASVEETVSKLEYDLEFLRILGVGTYLKVLGLTVWVSLRGKGGR